MTVRRVGLFGGVFNPVHLGHVALAKKAISSLSLEKLYIVPCSDPAHKHKPTVDAMLRFKMAEIAFKDVERVHVSPMEIERKGTSYTIDTIREVKTLEGGEIRLILIVGADNICEMKEWKNPEEIFAEADVAAFTRPGFDCKNKIVDGLGEVLFIEMEPQPYSSTIIRSRLAGNQSIDGMVPERVACFIKEKNLYK